MMIAIYNDRFDMAATLVELGADVNDGSLYVAVEMRDATTDQFAFDGSRRRPDNPNTLTALDLMKMLLDKGADPNKRFAGQFHSTSMPNSDRFDNTPFFRAADHGRRRGAEGADRARRQSRSDAAGDLSADPRRPPRRRAGGRAAAAIRTPAARRRWWR